MIKCHRLALSLPGLLQIFEICLLNDNDRSTSTVRSLIISVSSSILPGVLPLQRITYSNSPSSARLVMNGLPSRITITDKSSGLLLQIKPRTGVQATGCPNDLSRVMAFVQECRADQILPSSQFHCCLLWLTSSSIHCECNFERRK